MAIKHWNEAPRRRESPSNDVFKSRPEAFLEDLLQPNTGYWAQYKGEQMKFSVLCNAGGQTN